MSEKTTQKYRSQPTQNNNERTQKPTILYHFNDTPRIGVELPDGTVWIPGREGRLIDRVKYRTQYDALYRRFTRAYIAKLSGNAQSAAKHFEASMLVVGKHYFIGDIITERLRKHFRNKYLELLNILKRVDTATTSTDNDNHEMV